MKDPQTGESYVGLTAHDAYASLRTDIDKTMMGPSLALDDSRNWTRKGLERGAEKLHFMPYYFRANRGGKEHMRVGLRRWRREE